jgi:hypothetical protein
MRHCFATLLVLVAFLACLPTCRKAAGPSVEPKIETGDLLFVGIPMHYGEDSMAAAIADATSNGDTVNFIHTAILEVDSLGAVWVIDATLAHGVDRHPLDTLLADFVLHQADAVETFEVWRLKDNRLAASCVELAKTMLGEPYDEYFKPSNDRHYCTELVYDAYLDAEGAPLFETVPMNFKNKEGEMPEYWVNLFASLGEEIPQGVPGTNPQMMRESPNLVKVLSWTR